MFDFNTYSSLLLCPFLTGTIYSVLCFARYRKQGELYMLFLSLLLLLLTVRLSFWMLGFAGWYDRHDALTTLMFYFPFNTLALIGPCLYFYFLSLTNRDFRIKPSDWPHFVVPILLLLLYLSKFAIDFFFYTPFTNNADYQFGTRGPLAELDKSLLVFIAAYTSLFYYFYLIVRSLKGYKQYLVAHFAETESASLRWLKRLIWFSLLAVLLFFCFNFLNIFTRINYIANWYPYLLLGALIYYTAINGYAHSGGSFHLLHFTPATPLSDVIVPPLKELDYWKQSLDNLVALEKPQLDTAISLATLSVKLGTNSTVLSKVINEGYRQNFNDYINGLRVQAVISRLEQGEQEKYSLMGIAWDCGFNSKTTFNRSFKKVTGITPSDYIEQLHGSDHDMNRG